MKMVANLDAILRDVEKPGRYTGRELNSVVKDWDSVRVRVALIYPDVYEVGMSNLGMMILYDILNQLPDVLCERAYTPWLDMEERLRENGVPLYSLESHRSLRDFDIVGISLPYELNYTNVLTALDLAGIPLLALERGLDDPLVVAGGSGAYTLEPMADFFDLFVIGEGEEVLLELVRAYADWRDEQPEGPRGWPTGHPRASAPTDRAPEPTCSASPVRRCRAARRSVGHAAPGPAPDRSPSTAAGRRGRRCRAECRIPMAGRR